jgi:hypothetical protein
MEEGSAADGRRASMYDPARDIFAKGQEHGGPAERDDSTGRGQSSAITVAQTTASSPFARSSVC